MKVRTIKTHGNEYGVREGGPYEKLGSSHLIYEVPDDEARSLIAAGVVEKADAAPKRQAKAAAAEADKD